MFPIDTLAQLKQSFGHSQFRPGQEALIEALLTGRDVLGVMPTGAGKSICYQLPALLLPGITLVVSPLISLMKDQVAALSQAGIPSAYINSTLTPSQYREVYRRAKAGAYRLIYVAPERLMTVDFLSFARSEKISLLAVDEAHCVSQWGQDFRPSYLAIAQFAASLAGRPVIGAFTATATVTVKDDIVKLLALQHPLRVTTGFDRPNLHFAVAHPKNKDAYLRSFLAERPEQSGIIYCATRKKVEAVCGNLRQRGIAATRYHAGLDDEERRQNQEDFVFDRARVMVATNAFGMGIDKSNVGFVVHYNMPKNIESYYQEAGRAGRDGEPAHCVLLFSAGDIVTAKFLISHAEKSEALPQAEQELIHRQDLQRLEQMIAYCKTTDCLRAYLLQYFGEPAPDDCGNCGNCCADMVQLDITTDAQKILSAVARVEKRYPSGLGITMIVHMLHGSKEQRIGQLGLDELPTYGIMQAASRAQIRDTIDHLIHGGYLAMVGDDYPVVHLTELAKPVLFNGEKVLCTCRRPSASETEPAVKHKKAAALPAQADEGLFAVLKALRFRLAQAENVPAYVVFSNAALADMAVKQPQSLDDFLQVSGVGKVKAERYADVFLTEIRQWMEKASSGE